eukprot:7200812-Prymnesium_polylepis.1
MRAKYDAKLKAARGDDPDEGFAAPRRSARAPKGGDGGSQRGGKGGKGRLPASEIARLNKALAEADDPNDVPIPAGYK